MKIFWATRLRGFFKHMSHEMSNVEFIETNGYYETNSLLTKVKSSIIRSRLLNPLGIFQVISAQGKDCDYYGSFNRFLYADKPYFIYLENPTALYHYTLGRINYKLGNKKFNTCLNDPKLRYIVCMSDACKNTFEQINMSIPPHVKIKTIYPFVPNNSNVTNTFIEEKSRNDFLECLYCVQGVRFVSKGGLEVLSAYNRLRSEGYKIRLTVITKISDLDKKIKKRLYSCSDIEIFDFSFSYQEMERIYARTNVLLQPSSDDSFGLTVLESMKAGCAVVASKLYAFPEMIYENYNGYLIEPKYWFFDQNNIPNPKVWNRRKKTIWSKVEDERLVEDLCDRISKLYTNRDLLELFSQHSFDLANTKFGECEVCRQWEDVWAILEKGEKDET